MRFSKLEESWGLASLAGLGALALTDGRGLRRRAAAKIR